MWAWLSHHTNSYSQLGHYALQGTGLDHGTGLQQMEGATPAIHNMIPQTLNPHLDQGPIHIMTPQTLDPHQDPGQTPNSHLDPGHTPNPHLDPGQTQAPHQLNTLQATDLWLVG